MGGIFFKSTLPGNPAPGEGSENRESPLLKTADLHDAEEMHSRKPSAPCFYPSLLLPVPELL
jgi:hypothetical protein